MDSSSTETLAEPPDEAMDPQLVNAIDSIEPVPEPDAAWFDSSIDPVGAMIEHAAESANTAIEPIVQPLSETAAPVVRTVVEPVRPIGSPAIEAVEPIIESVVELQPDSFPLSEAIDPFEEPTLDGADLVAESLIDVSPDVAEPAADVLVVLDPAAGAIGLAGASTRTDAAALAPEPAGPIWDAAVGVLPAASVEAPIGSAEELAMITPSRSGQADALTGTAPSTAVVPALNELHEPVGASASTAEAELQQQGGAIESDASLSTPSRVAERKSSQGRTLLSEILIPPPAMGGAREVAMTIERPPTAFILASMPAVPRVDFWLSPEAVSAGWSGQAGPSAALVMVTGALLSALWQALQRRGLLTPVGVAPIVLAPPG